MAVVTTRQLLESGVHFGHQTRRWNPKMKRFIFTERNGIYIIDLQQSLTYIDRAYAFVKDTVARVLPLWHAELAPQIRAGKRLLVAAHGNSMRALIKYLDGISDADIVGVNIPNGIPLVYTLDADLKPISRRYLGDAEAVAAAAAAVAAQGQTRP